MSVKVNTKGCAVEAVVSGVVQGVGFRPFIYRLALEFDYKGWVKNIGFGVEIHIESQEYTDFSAFITALQKDKPPLTQIENIEVKQASYLELDRFIIKKSRTEESFVFISPDISVCRNCLKELETPSDRRFHYPFINCTDCGPRYTIVKSLPYDREQTTMGGFAMCPECRKEYSDPLDRRYHAQPIACPVCGPQVQLIQAKNRVQIPGGIKKAIVLLKKGKILGIKGLGGFHLVCDAFNDRAIQRLRKIKERKTKPLALMAKDLKVVKRYAFLLPAEQTQLLSARRPIVLLRKKKDIQGIAPHLDELGFMLPYTPVHFLLMKEMDLIVATSSNKKDAPIMKEEEEGIPELCDYILTHDRPIQMRADDSVMKLVGDEPLFLRRARGYVPYPQRVPEELSVPAHIMALGGELKDTVSLYKNGYVITSQFLGDLDEYQNFKYFEETISHLTRLFEVKPRLVVSDLHPDFHTTRYAQKLGIPHLQVQHHFAHVLAPLIEHGISPDKNVLGVSFDGFGYGDDGLAWGAEFLLADYSSYQRIAHFKYVPLPGGDLAAKQPWRMALSYLIDVFGSGLPEVEVLNKVSKNKIKGVTEMIRQKINSPLTSSCGRLFDAVSFLAGLSPLEVEFEAEAPMRLEAVCTQEAKGSYPFSVLGCSIPYKISFDDTVRSLVKDLEQKKTASYVSTKFHNTLAEVILSLSERARQQFGIDTVVLIGGVFLNRKLLYRVQTMLDRKGFSVLRPLKYSPNDESISLGQMAFALNKLRQEG